MHGVADARAIVSTLQTHRQCQRTAHMPDQRWTQCVVCTRRNMSREWTKANAILPKERMWFSEEKEAEENRREMEPEEKH